ncbi:MAG: hypothetical protein ACYDEF_14750 [Methanosarcina sp.]
MLTREEIFVIYEAGPEAVISVIQRLENIIEEEQAVRIAELQYFTNWIRKSSILITISNI